MDIALPAIAGGFRPFHPSLCESDTTSTSVPEREDREGVHTAARARRKANRTSSEALSVIGIRSQSLPACGQRLLFFTFILNASRHCQPFAVLDLEYHAGP